MQNFIIEIDTNTLARVIKTFLGFFCHQDKSILLSMYGDYLQLCPRCIGLHTGFFTTIVALVFINQKPRLIRKKISVIIPVLLATVTGFHWFGATIDIFAASSFTRFLHGINKRFCFWVSYLLLPYSQ